MSQQSQQQQKQSQQLKYPETHTALIIQPQAEVLVKKVEVSQSPTYLTSFKKEICSPGLNSNSDKPILVAFCDKYLIYILLFHFSMGPGQAVLLVLLHCSHVSHNPKLMINMNGEL